MNQDYIYYYYLHLYGCLWLYYSYLILEILKNLFLYCIYDKNYIFPKNLFYVKLHRIQINALLDIGLYILSHQYNLYLYLYYLLFHLLFYHLILKNFLFHLLLLFQLLLYHILLYFWYILFYYLNLIFWFFFFFYIYRYIFIFFK